MSGKVSNSATILYLDALTDIINNGRLVSPINDISSPGFARQSKPDEFLEDFPSILTLTNPRNRIIALKKLDLFNAIGQWFWFVKGDNSKQGIAFYNSLASKFIDDLNPDYFYGVWGYRTHNYISTILSLLKSDPSSRRIYVPVFYPEDLGYKSLNLPCLIGLHFFVRDNKIDCIANMRSSNAYNVFPYDIFVLTLVHEYISICADVEMGIFHFVANSLHIYKSYLDDVKKLLIHPFIDNSTIMPKMTKDNFSLLFEIEQKIKENFYNIDDIPTIISSCSLTPYWQDFLYVVYARLLYNTGHSLAGVEPLMTFQPLKDMMGHLAIDAVRT